MTVYVARCMLDILPDHSPHCQICDVRRLAMRRQAKPGVCWSAVMAAPEPWSSAKLRKFVARYERLATA